MEDENTETTERETTERETTERETTEREYKGRLIPLWVMGSKVFPLPKRILLVMATMADRDGVCRINIRTLAELVGMVDTGSLEEIQAALVPLRQARRNLIKSKLLFHVKSRNSQGYVVHGYRVSARAIPERCLEAWNRIGETQGVHYKALYIPSAEPLPADQDDQDDLLAV